jgi:hypothetical protein
VLLQLLRAQSDCNVKSIAVSYSGHTPPSDEYMPTDSEIDADYRLSVPYHTEGAPIDELMLRKDKSICRDQHWDCFNKKLAIFK